MGIVTNRLREVLEYGVTYPGDWTDLDIAQGIEWLEGVQKKREAERNQWYQVTYTGPLSQDVLRRYFILDGLLDVDGRPVRIPCAPFGLPQSSEASWSRGLAQGVVNVVKVD